MAVIRCPNCGKPNPDFLEVCQYCDAKLHAADGSPADSRAPSSAEDTFVGGRPPATPTTPPPTPEPEEEAQPLGWMDRLRQIQAGEATPAAKAQADEPDWMWTGTLRDPSQPKAASPAPTPPAGNVAGNDAGAELPEWLRDLGETGTLPPLEPPEPPVAPTTNSPSPSAPPPPEPAAPITNSQLPITSEPSPSSPPPATSPFRRARAAR